MDPIPGLSELRVRKRELLLESALNRQVWRVEIEKLRLQSERLKRGYGWAHGAWKWAAPLAGFLFARRFGRNSGAFTKGSIVLSVLGALWKVWEASRARPSDPAADISE